MNLKNSGDVNITITQEIAEEMIEEICKWLSCGAPGGNPKRVYETVPASLAREFCSELLDASDADGLGGCKYCQGQFERWEGFKKIL